MKKLGLETAAFFVVVVFAEVVPASAQEGILNSERIIRTGLSLSLVCALVVLILPRILRMKTRCHSPAADSGSPQLPRNMRLVERVQVSDTHALLLVEISSGERLVFSYDGESLTLQSKLPRSEAEGAHADADPQDGTLRLVK